ncbi:MAG: PDZ domain-containing protein [Acidobacteria bacterium]|nr:MAG: PDZ domain-containing protein [Acidobacteriota bacterium]REK00239.1 MAG: PDZ domain-containing protein [Acidobacteriota bacterium]
MLNEPSIRRIEAMPLPAGARSRSIVTVMIALLALIAPVGAGGILAQSAAESAGGEHERVVVEVRRGTGSDGVRVHELEALGCEPGEQDCERRRVLFVGEDGAVELPHGAHSWVSSDGDANTFVVRGGSWDFALGKRTMLGVELSEITDQLRETFGVPAGEGAMVSRVVEGSPAERAGIRAGDVITSVNGERVASARAIGAEVRRMEDGETAALEVWRDGTVRQMSAQVEVKELGSGAGPHVIRLHQLGEECEDGDDCQVRVRVLEGGDLGSFDPSALCGGSGQCRVQVECDGGSCECTVNDEPHDCSGIPGLPE